MSESGRGQPPRHGHDGGLLDVPAHALEFSAVKPDAAAPRAAVDHEHVRGFLDHLGTVDGASLELFMRGFHHQPHLFHASFANWFVVFFVTGPGSTAVATRGNQAHQPPFPLQWFGSKVFLLVTSGLRSTVRGPFPDDKQRTPAWTSQATDIADSGVRPGAGGLLDA